MRRPHRRLRTAPPLLRSLLVFTFIESSSPAAAERVVVTILQTTDLHGHLLPWDYQRAQPSDDGLARVASRVVAIRAETPNVLLLDAGDVIQVIDFKTSKSRWSPSKVAESASQLHLYAELATPLAEGKPLQLAFAVLTKAKRRPSLTLHPVPHDLEAVEATLRRVWWTWRDIQRGDFPARPSLWRWG